MTVNQQQIQAAKAGDAAVLAELIEPYRQYLKLLARMQIGPKIRGKADESDIVQETFLNAHCSFPEFQGETEGQLVEWLRSILAAKLAELFRRYLGTQQRDVRLEREIGEAMGQSTMIMGAGFAVGLISPESSPSHRASRHEEAVRLADALSRLPGDYREAIVLRNLEGLPFKQVAERMGKTEASVEKLWLRGLAKLREQLGGHA
ncbi:sigma-70 family RNA polymerase sigma factor [Planctomicrobium sp. SH664]|uniref:sigma-70 family RNA polymerase sigma factor n=1 Tax=Planctomicrobium sp. SH664 TaxID=3448125 RepID=UPI003F5C6CF6